MLINRYPTIAGCRLDTDEDDGMTGPAIDASGQLTRGDARLWVRQAGSSADGTARTAEVALNVSSAAALRDGLTRMLVEADAETMVTVTVPVPRRHAAAPA